jgi:hypothetical protein
MIIPDPKSNVGSRVFCRTVVAWCASVLVITLTLLGSPSSASGIIAPEWREHFTTNLVIEECVFEETSFSFGTTNLFHVIYQENAFLVRQVHSLEEAKLDHITSGAVYAGRLGSNYWAIDGGRVLKLFPNATELIQQQINPEVSLIEAPRRKLVGALFYGFHLVDPHSIQWLDENTFTAASFRGNKFLIRGTIHATARGLPTLIEWSVEGDSQLHFMSELKYKSQLDLGYYPSEIVLRAIGNGKQIPVVAYRILTLKPSPTNLSSVYFESERFFSPPVGSLPIVIQVSNDSLYFKASKGWEKVSPLSRDTDDYDAQVNRSGRRPLVIVVLLMLSGAGCLLLWKNVNTKTKLNKTKDKL